MRQLRVRANGADIGIFTPTREYDIPKNTGWVFGKFEPLDAYSEIADLFRYADERGGSDWDNSLEANERRNKLELGLFTDAGDQIPAGEITIYDCTMRGITSELRVRLLSREQVDFVLSNP